MGVYNHKETPKLRDDITTKVEWAIDLCIN
jgi:hypothetical protein